VGFVSEWFLLESLMQQFRVGRLPYALPMALAGALVALTVGFAAVAFVRIIGLLVLGPTPRRSRVRPLDAGWCAGTGLVLLSMGCVGIAAIGALWIRVLSAGLSSIIPEQLSSGSLKSPWVLQPVYAEFSAVSPSWLSMAMPVVFIAVLAATALLGWGRMFHVRHVPAWRSATDGVTGDSHYTPFGFANPTRKVLATMLLTRAELTVLEWRSGGSEGDTKNDTENDAESHTRPGAQEAQRDPAYAHTPGLHHRCRGSLRTLPVCAPNLAPDSYRPRSEDFAKRPPRYLPRLHASCRRRCPRSGRRLGLTTRLSHF
jgi:hypothetical protein